MTEIEALQNQFHDELHTTNLKVIDVSTNLAALSDRVDAISDSNTEVNNNLNRIANSIDDANTGVNRANDRIDQVVSNIDNINDDINDINRSFDKQNDINDEINGEISTLAKELDDHESRISSLENQTKQTAHEVAVRAAKSVTRSIEQSEIQELHEEIHEVALAVDNLDANLEPRVINLENDTAELQRQAVALHLEDSSIWNAMEDMDVEHHEELHRLALAIDNHESRISYIETHWNNYDEEIERLDNKIDSSISEVKEYVDDKIDSSISEVKEYVDDKIDDVSTGLANVTTIVNNLPPHIVLTKEEYDDLDNPDYNSFYFTYEDEE